MYQNRCGPMWAPQLCFLVCMNSPIFWWLSRNFPMVSHGFPMVFLVFLWFSYDFPHVFSSTEAPLPVFPRAEQQRHDTSSAVPGRSSHSTAADRPSLSRAMQGHGPANTSYSRDYCDIYGTSGIYIGIYWDI